MGETARVADARPSLPVDGDEVRVKTGGRIRDYVSYVIDRMEVRTSSRDPEGCTRARVSETTRHAR
jgi:hypothetical protein